MTSLQGLVYTGDDVNADSIIWNNAKEARKLTKKEMIALAKSVHLK